MKSFKIFEKNAELYDQMIEDILAAKKHIFLETYTFDNDEVGDRFKKALNEKLRHGVDVRLLLDYWGSGANENFFKDLIEMGAKVEFFRKLRFGFNIINKNNHRNHRKSLVIDGEISYIGSSNITSDSIDWRETNLRIRGEISELFKKAFLQNFEIANKYIFKKRAHVKLMSVGDFSIVRDVPSVGLRKIRKKQIALVKKAVKDVYIKTPYLLPDVHLMNELMRAVKRGVEVICIIPKRSDYKIVDLLRAPYLGLLHQGGVKIMLYKPGMMHSKMMIVDDVFSIGSHNLDFRSAFLQFEMNLIGRNREMLAALKASFIRSLEFSEGFDFGKWKKRSVFKRKLEWVLDWLKHQL